MDIPWVVIFWNHGVSARTRTKSLERNELRTKYRKTKTYKHRIKPPNECTTYFYDTGRGSDVKGKKFSVLSSQISGLGCFQLESRRGVRLTPADFLMRVIRSFHPNRCGTD